MEIVFLPATLIDRTPGEPHLTLALSHIQVPLTFIHIALLICVFAKPMSQDLARIRCSIVSTESDYFFIGFDRGFLLALSLLHIRGASLSCVFASLKTGALRGSL